MSDTHPLDRPIWSMLTGRQSHLAKGDASVAIRIDPAYGPFGAAADTSPDALSCLARHVPDSGELWLVEDEPWPLPPATREIKRATLAQMVADMSGELPESEFEIMPLGEDDAAEMAALADHAKPGPWSNQTHRYGPFFGIRENDRLLAMAGQRMLMPGMAEVSGVSTWADCRGRGYARALIGHVMTGMRERGEQPFLHSYADNAGAIALYQSLGFRIRREVHVLVMAQA